jgi:phage FluMu protein Com
MTVAFARKDRPMNAVLDKIEVACPQCGKTLSVPFSAAGKLGRCPNCKRVFPIDMPRETARPEPIDYGSRTKERADDDAALALMQPSAAAANNYAPTNYAASNYAASNYAPAVPPPEPAKSYNHGFGWEHRGWDKGMLGGLAMMGIAVLWFFVGLACGVIFYYPPILFVIGLVGFFRGLFTGNIAGR